jgi:uncharacterized membrane protein
MSTTYNRIAGQSVERIAALSDGVFAIAMILLVLDLRVPASRAIHSEPELWSGLAALLPRLVIFAMSVITLGIFWIGQQTQLNHLRRSDRSLSCIHITFLGFVSLIPFSTALLAEYPRYRIALLVYWVNILLMGAVLYWSWVCALGNELVREELSLDITQALKRRIVVTQTLYACGAVLCFVDTRIGIAVIVLVQVSAAIATPWSRKL